MEEKSYKKQNIVLIFIGLLFFLTIGYAYLTSQLNITGSSIMNSPTWNIHFENIDISENSVPIDTEHEEKAATIDDATTVSYSVSLPKPGDYYEFTVDVKNDGSIDGMIESVTSKLNDNVISELPDYLNYKVVYEDGVPIEPNHKLLAGEKETYRVKIEYKKDITEEDIPETDQTLNVEFTVVYVQKDTNAIDKPQSLSVIKPVTYTMVTEDGFTYPKMDENQDFRTEEIQEKVKRIILLDELDPPTGVIETWDMSAGQDGNVMAYLTANPYDSTMYDLYIQGNGGLNANPDSTFLFAGFYSLDEIQNINLLNVSNVTNMTGMFSGMGYDSTVFQLDLGDHFDTSNVTNMMGMFEGAGAADKVFTINLGNRFDTSKVTNMSGMFTGAGYDSTVMTLDLGDKFDTSNVTDMSYMFNAAGYESTVMTLDLGDKFDTSNVTNMEYMFEETGYKSTRFTIDLGDKFDTSKVTNMDWMFRDMGVRSTIIHLDLGDKFDTSNVTSMEMMFSALGYYNTNFTLSLGDKFDTSNVTNTSSMFYLTGYKSTKLKIDLGDKFDTSKVTQMKWMFYDTGRASTVLTIDLGDKFDTSNVTSMCGMFGHTGYSNSSFTLDLGDKFDTSGVTDMCSMFESTAHSNNNFELDLSGFTFDSVTESEDMFYGWKTTQKVYVKNATDQAWVISKNTSVLSTSNVLIKSN